MLSDTFTSLSLHLNVRKHFCRTLYFNPFTHSFHFHLLPINGLELASVPCTQNCVSVKVLKIRPRSKNTTSLDVKSARSCLRSKSRPGTLSCMNLRIFAYFLDFKEKKTTWIRPSEISFQTYIL